MSCSLQQWHSPNPRVNPPNDAYYLIDLLLFPSYSWLNPQLCRLIRDLYSTRGAEKMRVIEPKNKVFFAQHLLWLNVNTEITKSLERLNQLMNQAHWRQSFSLEKKNHNITQNAHVYFQCYIAETQNNHFFCFWISKRFSLTRCLELQVIVIAVSV